MIASENRIVGSQVLRADLRHPLANRGMNRKVPIFDRIREDVRSVLERDPAARSWLEVLHLLSGPCGRSGIHRVSHQLWAAKLRLLARILSQVGRLLTGVDIHPAAPSAAGSSSTTRPALSSANGHRRQRRDTIPGSHLGGTGKEHGKRHPTLCDGVFVGNNANVLGNITIGANSRVGAGSVVLTRRAAQLHRGGRARPYRLPQRPARAHHRSP